MDIIPSEWLNCITPGDCRDLAARLSDESVDMIFTDPPYHDEYLWTWPYLGELGARVLKSGGLLLAYAGKHALPVVLQGLAAGGLDYFWTFCAVQLNSDTRFVSRRLFSNWRPIVAYGKPGAKALACLEWTADAQKSVRDKRYHAWGQGSNVVEYYLLRLTLPGAIVLDPFAGGGAVPAACNAHGRQFIAFELDPSAVAIAQQRVDTVPSPLLVYGSGQYQPALGLAQGNG